MSKFDSLESPFSSVTSRNASRSRDQTSDLRLPRQDGGWVGGIPATSTHGALPSPVKSTLSSPPHSQASCRGSLHEARRDWHPGEGDRAPCQASSQSLAQRWYNTHAHTDPCVIISTDDRKRHNLSARSQRRVRPCSK